MELSKAVRNSFEHVEIYSWTSVLADQEEKLGTKDKEHHGWGGGGVGREITILLIFVQDCHKVGRAGLIPEASLPVSSGIFSALSLQMEIKGKTTVFGEAVSTG